MFHKEKFKADGGFYSYKRGPSKIEETTCPTVNPILVMNQLNLGAVNRDTLI
jgi:hypothetical protein